LSVAEERVRPIFGPITVEEMSANEALARLVLKVVADACKHSKGRYSAQTIAAGLKSGEMKLWGVLTPPNALEAAIVTRTEGKAFEMIIQGPHMDDVLPFLAVLEQHAKRLGCDRITMTGPKFFDRLLPAGWRVREVKFEHVFDAG